MNIKHSDISIPNKSKRNKTTDFLITTETCALFIFACIFMYFFFHLVSWTFGLVRCVPCTFRSSHVLCGLFGILLLSVQIHFDTKKEKNNRLNQIKEYMNIVYESKFCKSIIFMQYVVHSYIVFPILKHCPNGTKPNLR